MSTKTNSDSDRDVLRSLVPTSSGQYAQIKLHDYNYATNGWLNGRLVNNGKAWAEIENYLPLEDNVLDGFTFDILFKNNNTGINEARVVDCTGPDNPYIGFYIDSEKAVATTDANQNVSYYTDRTDMRITFVVNRTSTFFEEYIIDPEKIGYETCAYIGLNLKQPETFDAVVEELKKIPEVVECHYTTGNYDLFTKIYARNNHHLLNIIHDKLQPLGLSSSETIISFNTAIDRQLPVSNIIDEE